MKRLCSLALALVATWVFALSAHAQAMSQVPGNALLVLHINNIQALSQKMTDWSKQVGLADMNPAGAAVAADPLGFGLAQLNISKGVNKDGDFALAIINTPDLMNGLNPPVVMLVPVTDYPTFLGNFPDAKTDGDVSTVSFGVPPAPTYVAKWGNYAALSPFREVITAGVATPITVSDAATKEMAAKDVSILVNMATVRALTFPQIATFRATALPQLTQSIKQTPLAKYSGLISATVNEIIDTVESLMTDCDDVVASGAIDPSATGGLSGSLLVNFKAGSHYGDMVTSEKNTDATLLAGLPDFKYLLLGGGVTDPKISSKLISDLIDPIQPEIDKLGPDGQWITDYIQAIKDASAAQTGAEFGMVAPEGELGAGPLLQTVAIRNGDAKTIAATASKLLEMQQKQMKAMMMGAPNITQTAFTPAGKTLDGVTFDQYHVGFDMTAFAGNPQMAKIGQIMSLVYGPDGMNIYSGEVSDSAVLQVVGLADDKISAAIAAAKAGDDPEGKLASIQSTASHLPTQREAVFYIPVDTMVNTTFTYIGKFGLDMGVTMPACDPIGVTVGVDGSTARMDGYVPNAVVSGSTAVTKKLTGAHAGPGGGL